MHILYLGDNTGSSAEYLKDVLSDLEHTYVHVDAADPIHSIDDQYDGIVLSDYPARHISVDLANQITDLTSQGKRLIMLGGWDSFNGRGENYTNHPLAKIVPVHMQNEDDRVNVSQGLILEKGPALETSLPIDWQHPPVICGYNAFEADETASVLVWMRPIDSDGSTIRLLKEQPCVVAKNIGQGVSLACATDLAPHWCGGLVDWGSERRKLAQVEVGDMYIQFIRLLLEIKPSAVMIGSTK